jgi:hypothetical protein
MTQRTSAPPQPLCIGDTWVFTDGSPWPSNDPVRIVDVRDGWVRYEYVSGEPMRRHSKVEVFISMHRPCVSTHDDAEPCRVCGRKHCGGHAQERRA